MAENSLYHPDVTSLITLSFRCGQSHQRVLKGRAAFPAVVRGSCDKGRRGQRDVMWMASQLEKGATSQ